MSDAENTGQVWALNQQWRETVGFVPINDDKYAPALPVEARYSETNERTRD
ncbi:MAG: hypothetical protein V3W41_17630 [Planctomycetota bacterium]